MIAYLPLSLIYLISASQPIYLYILNKIYYKTEITKKSILGCILSFIGLYLILFIQQQDKNLSGNNVSKYDYVSGKTQILFGLIMLISTFIGAYGIMLTKKFK